MNDLVSGLRDLFAVVKGSVLAETWRRRGGLHAAVAQARSVGRTRPVLPQEHRSRLKRQIRMVDRWVPGGANCVRRALVEMALDAGAAREIFYAGLRKRGGSKSGHAWLASDVVTDRYDAVITI
jgi:hypothetical protein